MLVLPSLLHFFYSLTSSYLSLLLRVRVNSAFSARRPAHLPFPVSARIFESLFHRAAGAKAGGDSFPSRSFSKTSLREKALQTKTATSLRMIRHLLAGILCVEARPAVTRFWYACTIWLGNVQVAELPVASSPASLGFEPQTAV